MSGLRFDSRPYHFNEPTGARNPLIGFDRFDTAKNCAGVSAFLARVHHCIADIEEQNPGFFDGDTPIEKHGLACVLDCVTKALQFAFSDGQDDDAPREPDEPERGADGE